MAKKLSNEIKPAVIQPIIRVDGEKHILEEMFESGDAPEMKSVGYMQIGNGAHSWVSYVITTRGTEVLKIEVDQPNMRPIAEESAKIGFTTNLMDQGL
jgi:hypothetical protein